MGRNGGPQNHKPSATSSAEDARMEDMYAVSMRILDAERWAGRLETGVDYTPEDGEIGTARRHALALLWVARRVLRTPNLRLQTLRLAARYCGLQVAPWAGGHKGKEG